MRDSVVIYKSFHEASKMMQPEEYKELWTSLFEYALNDEEPEFSSALADVIFTMAQPQIDANKKRHGDGCKGGAPKGNQNAKKQPKQPLVDLENNHRLIQKQPNENENENVNVNKKENIKEKKAPKAPRTPQEEKHMHGEYKHVRLTDSQYNKLAEDFGEVTREAAIKRLDEYIQEKPTYKSQDHNLAIRRWVIKALEEDKQKTKTGKVPNTTFHSFDNRHEYNFEEMERQLLGG